ncbi:MULTISPECIES: PD-(D/E)XK nuclease family transposase, partial [Bacteroides]
KALQERIFTKLFEAAEIAKFTKTEYDSYEESLKIYRDWKNTIDTAKIKSKEEGRKEGLKEGEKIGIEKGAKKKAIEMVQSLKAKGVAISIIAECSGLSEEEINSL